MSIHDRGFAHMSLEKRRAIAILGGMAAQASGHGRRWTPEEARAQAKRGWAASQETRRVRQDALRINAGSQGPPPQTVAPNATLPLAPCPADSHGKRER